MTMIKSRYYGPASAAGEPRQIVAHSVESSIIPGLARSLATGWFRNPINKTSAHGIADPREHIDTVPTSERAWHVGNGNSTSIGREHVGRARFDRAQWTTGLGMKMLRNAARADARDCKKFNIPVRWLSLTQLANNEKGFCTHNDMRLVRGGTTHTDPGPGFPYDLYLNLVREALGQNEGDDMAGLTDKLTLTDYRGRFTDGSSPDVTMTLEQFIGNTWEFVKFTSGLLEKTADEISDLRAEVRKLNAKLK